jgi:hypothetical protein
MEQVMMQIRAHRGALEESVKTMQTIPATLQAIREYMAANTSLPFSKEELETVQVDMYNENPEERITGWDGPTYIISVKPTIPRAPNNPRVFFGYCSKPVDEKEAVLDPSLAEHLRKMTPVFNPQDPKEVLERSQKYVQELIGALIQSGMAGNVLEQTTRLFLNHPGFDQWVKTTREERETAPDVVKAILAEADMRLEDLRHAVKTLLPMIADHKGFVRMLEIMRKRDIPIYNEETTAKKYAIVLRGEFGTIPLAKYG